MKDDKIIDKAIDDICIIHFSNRKDFEYIINYIYERGYRRFDTVRWTLTDHKNEYDTGDRYMKIYKDNKDYIVSTKDAFYSGYDIIEYKCDNGVSLKFKSEKKLIEYLQSHHIAVNTRTQIEYDCFMMLIERNGVMWSTKTKPTDMYLFERFNSKLGITLCSKDHNGNGYCDIDRLKMNEYEIITFEEFYEMLE